MMKITKLRLRFEITATAGEISSSLDSERNDYDQI